MRQKRAKTYRKLMHLYSMSFRFRQPYQILVDSEMCKIAIDSKLDLTKQFATVLQGNVKPMITQCSMQELYLQGKERQPAVDFAKTFERRKCNHREAIPGDECLLSVIGDTNKHRYVVATQSQSLRNSLRIIPAVPVVHINRTVMVLEPPSEATLKAKELTEEQSLRPSAPELATVPQVKPVQKKRKGPKGPNPLSVKKKKLPEASSRPSQKSKAEISDTSSNLSTAGSSGQKRKHESQDINHEHVGQSVGMADGTQDITMTRTRKRRRKTAAVPPSLP
ncbi:Fcf1-domain-containing protein [Suillus paluster]|uniref:Fcf1-domain-containing protein n=1 Tax=Suillus paluster TaxID=48578 RepID=UPI001B85BF11|nr:Fcf1-domain-containing protein [Suillus paluster]KAG1755104.1 Fcf1-domain-containing protein [Suillus paluster]